MTWLTRIQKKYWKITDLVTSGTIRTGEERQHDLGFPKIKWAINWAAILTWSGRSSKGSLFLRECTCSCVVVYFVYFVYLCTCLIGCTCSCLLVYLHERVYLCTYLRGCTCSCKLLGNPCQTSSNRTCALATWWDFVRKYSIMVWILLRYVDKL